MGKALSCCLPTGPRKVCCGQNANVGDACAFQLACHEVARLSTAYGTILAGKSNLPYIPASASVARRRAPTQCSGETGGFLLYEIGARGASAPAIRPAAGSWAAWAHASKKLKGGYLVSPSAAMLDTLLLSSAATLSPMCLCDSLKSLARQVRLRKNPTGQVFCPWLSGWQSTRQTC